MLSFLHGPTLTSIHDYWKNYSFDNMDICWQRSKRCFSKVLCPKVLLKARIPWWPNGQDSMLSLPRAWVWFLVRELRTHKPGGVEEKKNLSVWFQNHAILEAKALATIGYLHHRWKTGLCYHCLDSGCLAAYPLWVEERDVKPGASISGKSCGKRQQSHCSNSKLKRT